MPAGGTFMGFVYFAAAKYAGYTAFCKWFIGSQLEEFAPQLRPAGAAGAFAHPGEDGAALPPITQGPSLPSFWVAGAARTMIGLAIGAAVGLGYWRIPYFAKLPGSIGVMIFFAGLVPVRIFEWWLLLAWIYKEFPIPPVRVALIVTAGILVSFALDVLGIVSATFLPGGVWVC